MKANLTFGVARVERTLFSVVCVLIVALASGVLANSALAQPCAAAWNYYLDPVGPDRHVRSLAVHNGLLYARGDWSTVAGTPANNVAVFNGTNWSGAIAATWPYSGGDAGNTGLVPYQGSLYAPLGGETSFPTNYTIGAIWSGTAWLPWPTNGLWHNPDVQVNINRGWRAAVHQNRLFVAGSFFHPKPAGTGGDRRLFAVFDGANWSRMDGGFGPDSTASDRIESIVSYQGALYVGGFITQIRHGEQGVGTTTPAANIARYSGGAWSALTNGGLNGRVYTMCVFSNDLYVGGDFTATADSSISLLRIARLHNGAWMRVGGGLTGARPRSMAVANDGRGRALFIGATSGEANNAVPPTSDTVPVANIVRWNGVRYSAMGDGITGGNAVFAMTSYNPGTGEALFVGADSLRDPDDESFFGRTARWGPAAMVDSDGDGLFDVWETSGIDGDCDGTIDLPLHQMGANPQRKDIFVEIDSMAGRPVISAALSNVVRAFSNAPVANPSGPPGVSLHLLTDENDLLLQDRLTNGMADFHPIKLVHFGTKLDRDPTNSNSRAILDARAHVFHYCIFGNHYGTTKSSGLGELPGNDFMVTLGDPATRTNEVLEAQLQAATVMHELGHNLGLYHGGTQIDRGNDFRYNYKPNYRSIMNYAWSFAWNRRGWTLDYSTNALPPLNESALSEGNGVGAPYEAVMIYGPAPAIAAWMDLPVDWNRNTNIDAGLVSADINAIVTNTPSPGDILLGAEDWSRLIYDFRNHPNYGDGVSLEDTEIIDMHFTPDLVELTGALVALLISREGNEVKLTWSDTRYTLQATTDFNQWVDLPGVTSPATLSANLPYRFFRVIWRRP